MTHIATAMTIDPVRGLVLMTDRAAPTDQTVLVVRDGDRRNEFLDAICDFLDVGVEYMTGEEDLSRRLLSTRPMAIVADIEGETQDGYHVMKVVAENDRSLPIVLLGRDDPALLGAADAVREIWGLRRVEVVSDTAGIGPLVDFICQSVRDAGKTRLMRT